MKRKGKKIKLTSWLRPETDEALRSYSYFTNHQLSEVVDKAISEYIERIENEQGIKFPRRSDIKLPAGRPKEKLD